MTETTPPNSTIISQLPIASSVNDGDNILTQREDKSLVKMPANLLKGQKGDTGAQGPAGPSGQNGKDGKDAPVINLEIKTIYDDKPPDGWFLLDGGAFDKETYPLLSQKFPSGTLPDFRSRVARGAGNLIALGEVQEDAIQNITGSVSTIPAVPNSIQVTGALDKYYNGLQFYYPDTTVSGSWNWAFEILFDASKAIKTADETRVKAIGVNFIIKAG